jgi:hypothetical protein
MKYLILAVILFGSMLIKDGKAQICYGHYIQICTYIPGALLNPVCSLVWVCD